MLFFLLKVISDLSTFVKAIFNTKEEKVMDQKLEVKAALRILKPADIVYEAIVDPVKMSNYFISEGSDRMEDGKEIQCGWLKDKFGVSWQIIPSILSELMTDPEKSEKVTRAFLKMKKFDIKGLLEA